MNRRLWAGAVLITCVSLLMPGTRMPAAPGRLSHSPSVQAGRTVQAQPDFGKMPVTLIPNRGQLDERVDYYIQGKNKTIYFGADGVTFAVTGAPPEKNPRWVVKLDFVGANPGVRPVGTDRTGTTISYFQGEPGNWKSGLCAYSRIVYANLWPGIDLAYSGTMDELKYEFIVHPGADPSRIRLAYRGASSVLVDARGRLAVSTPSGGFEDGAPIAYQEKSGTRANVPLAYEMTDSSSRNPENSGSQEKRDDSVAYGFRVGDYDRTRTLVLDPVILVYCGFIGGPNSDYGNGIAADKKGNAYIVGTTSSMEPVFPVAVGPDLTFNRGSADAFVAKVNASGTALDYCGFIGGSGDDYGYAIAVDSFGSAYVTGYTNSTEATFPVKIGPDLTQNGLFDVFVAKINPSGTALDYCGYIGGTGHDYGRGIAVDASGCAYVTGNTLSTEATFPVVGGPSLTQNGNNDAFVAKVKADGQGLDYCGFIGGSGQDYGRGIAVDGAGNAYVTGSTNSTEKTFPILVGPTINEGGDFDAFVAKLDPQGTIVYCGYIGGSSEDVGTGIAVDGSGIAYVTGYAASSEQTFPIIAGPYMTYNGGSYDAFVAKIEADGSVLDYCGFIGGAAYDVGTGIAVDRWGYAYVTGYTSSVEATFPAIDGPSLTHSGSFDAFVAKVVPDGTALVYCGYIGGSDSDLGMGLALDADGSGNVFLTGNTYSMESSFPVVGGPGLFQSGGRDGFVAKINEVSLVVRSPNGGEVLHTGLTTDITWATWGQVGDVRIELSTDDGESWTDIVSSTENDGIYTWLVPDLSSTDCRIRISEAEDGDPTDTSNAVFTISNEPVIIVTSPNGGESWAVGSTKNITWLSAGVGGTVKIEYSTDNAVTWTEIVASTENNGIYAWLVPDAVSDTCFVQISDAENGTPVDDSDSVFSIVPASTHLVGPPKPSIRPGGPSKIIKSP